MSAREKIAYLSGLIEGQNITENAGMSKYHEALLAAFNAIAEEMDDIVSGQEDLKEYVEDIEDELLSLETARAGAHQCSNDGADDEGDDYDEEEEYEPATCPECGKDFFYQPDVYDEDEDLLCPHCGKPFKQ